MPQFVALLRGVNVGKGHRVPMAGLKLMLEGLGYSAVKTLLNSGNAVFVSTGRSQARHAALIADALQETYGVSTPVIVKSAAEIQTIIDDQPIAPPEAQHSRFLVAFAQEQSALQALEPLRSLAEEPERLVITPHAAYLHAPAGLLESKVGKALVGKPGRDVTTRNWATVLKLGALLDC